MTYPYSRAASIAEQYILSNIRDKIATANILPLDLNNMIADYATISPVAERLASLNFISRTYISEHAAITLCAINGFYSIHNHCVYCNNEQPHIDVYIGVDLPHRPEPEKMCGKFQIHSNEILLCLIEDVPIIGTWSMSDMTRCDIHTIRDQINAGQDCEESYISESHVLSEMTEIFNKFRDHIIW
jgi:hypothetical protein